MRTIVIACCLAAIVARAPVVAEDNKRPALKVARTIEMEEQPYGLAFSPDAKVFAVTDGRRIYFWDPATGKEARDAWKTDDYAVDLTFLDARTLAHTNGAGQTIHIRSYPTGKEVA